MNLLSLSAIKLRLASSEEILKWSKGEVIKPETINYRTGKPEKDGLFCERIFGPIKDWECYCGKYKRIRYKGIVCDKCGVEVTRSIVRRERMGHISLAVPVAHIWFLRCMSSKIGLVLGIGMQNLEKVIYLASYLTTSVNKQNKRAARAQISQEFAEKEKNLKANFKKALALLKQARSHAQAEKKSKAEIEKIDKQIRLTQDERSKKEEELKKALIKSKNELDGLKPGRVLSEIEYRSFSLKYGGVFEAGIGAEAVKALLAKIDLDKRINFLVKLYDMSSTTEKIKIKKRLMLLESLRKSNQRPEWMVPTVLPVIPPDLRPMVQLDGGRFAASDLNDLYRRIINRNNRLRRLQELDAPEVIQRNEKRMLQEAVDALIDNDARRGKAAATSSGQKRALKSLADILKGKQGRFRQNLLGKRVDYSGRSVIVVGPHLKLNECGLPKIMALELFKPFVISKLIAGGLTHNVRSAGKLIEQAVPEVWDALEEVIKDKHVLLNRAPTLHRLSIQAFKPVLIEGKAIQVHPMVCSAFNADFDGDQMAVHVPLSDKAQSEAREIMLSAKNLLKPATGDPIATPTKDVVLGVYYMTSIKPGEKGEAKIFSSPQEVKRALFYGQVALRVKIKVRVKGKLEETSVGRVLFNEVLPADQPFINALLDKRALGEIVKKVLKEKGNEQAVKLIDDIKDLGFEYLTLSGLSWGMDDLETPTIKQQVMTEAEKETDLVFNQYRQGLLTEEERYNRVVEIWAQAKDKITELVKKSIDRSGPVFSMIDSGARGSWGQVTQMMGMKGLVANPAGRTIELPVKANFNEGFSVLEYFISTHGARKGMSDTALRTASAGYLTRRLVDVAQDMVVREEKCQTSEYITYTKEDSEVLGKDLIKRILGRFLAEDLVNTQGKVLVKKDEMITEDMLAGLTKEDIKTVSVYSPLSCRTPKGVCARCYGLDLGRREVVKLGEAIGIVAAQSIGEPGTQLTMRTFHTGGVAEGDITQGLPRVEELFEARSIKNPAVISEIDGIFDFKESGQQKILTVVSQDVIKDEYLRNSGDKVLISDKSVVERGQALIQRGRKKIKAKAGGIVIIERDKLVVNREGEIKEYIVPIETAVTCEFKQVVKRGQALTEGSIDVKKLFKIAGEEPTRKYIIQEVQKIYANQGQDVNDKHIEIIVRQMFSRLKIEDQGETDFITGEIVDRVNFMERNAKTKKPAKAENLILGITKASLNTDSFLSAASFQETSRVLIEAAVMNKADRLEGLKENVIIGKLIPAGTGFRRDKKN